MTTNEDLIKSKEEKQDTLKVIGAWILTFAIITILGFILYITTGLDILHYVAAAKAGDMGWSI